jgi:hypothetical protein
MTMPWNDDIRAAALFIVLCFTAQERGGGAKIDLHAAHVSQHRRVCKQVQTVCIQRPIQFPWAIVEFVPVLFRDTS